MKTILLAADSPGGGGSNELAKLISRLEALDARVIALENTKALPTEVRLAAPLIKSTTQHFQEELAELESNPDKRRQLLLDGGLTEEKADAHISGRIRHLHAELGIKPALKKAAKAAAAMLIGLFVLAASLLSGATRCQADQQGYPQTYVSLTNVPPVVNASSSSNALTATYGLTNVVILHRGAGLGLQIPFITGPGATSNETYFVRFSVDGTNYDPNLIPITRAANGTNIVYATTNWNANQLAGYTSMELDGATNGNDVPLTNGVPLVNRPNGGP